eukprot:TRINITY_DN1198_c0_g1_i1.p1 TRINITY_DN1198_c0_g1~~TRINITY_DN1198_c0_g1_i1.p1  ORF type:complete len:227 (-),score=45.52 TRINITY_DN1198_c0_g1_i1:2174-2854(-)
MSLYTVVSSDGNAPTSWESVPFVNVDNFHEKSSPLRPKTRVAVQRTDDHIHVRFEVREAFIQCRHHGYNAAVYRDSCVEFFFQPEHADGYFNLEMNCCGDILMYYIQDEERLENGEFRKYQKIESNLLAEIKVTSKTFSESVEQEIAQEKDWHVEYSIPLSLLARIVLQGQETGNRSLVEVLGKEWKGNFYKCAEDNSQPHWASWSKIGDALNFHVPQYFGRIHFS